MELNEHFSGLKKKHKPNNVIMIIVIMDIYLARGSLQSTFTY